MSDEQRMISDLTHRLAIADALVKTAAASAQQVLNLQVRIDDFRAELKHLLDAASVEYMRVSIRELLAADDLAKR